MWFPEAEAATVCGRLKREPRGWGVGAGSCSAAAGTGTRRRKTRAPAQGLRRAHRERAGMVVASLPCSQRDRGEQGEVWGRRNGTRRKKRQGRGSSGDWELLLRLLAGEEARRRSGATVICSPASSGEVEGIHGRVGTAVVGRGCKTRRWVRSAGWSGWIGSGIPRKMPRRLKEQVPRF